MSVNKNYYKKKKYGPKWSDIAPKEEVGSMSPSLGVK